MIYGSAKKKQEAFAKDVKRLERVLSIEHTLTAKALAKLLDCSKQAIYRQIKALGSKVRFKMIREGSSGPRSKGYYLA